MTLSKLTYCHCQNEPLLIVGIITTKTYLSEYGFKYEEEMVSLLL